MLNWPCMHVLRLFAAVCILPLSAAAIENNPQNASAKDLASQLKNAVMEETRKLGALESWQKRIFDEEVLTQHQRFIKDYRFSGPNAKVYAEVDVEGLKAYLRFYAPKVITAENFKALVCLRAEAGCDKCMESLKTVKKLVEQMLERRGLSAVIIKLVLKSLLTLPGNGSYPLLSYWIGEKHQLMMSIAYMLTKIIT